MATASSDTFSEEQLNYFRICHVTDHVTDGLRKVFKQEWNARYKTTHGEWNDTAQNGIDFYSLIPAKEQKLKAKELSIIRNGNTMEWDCTCLFYAIIYSDCIGKNKMNKLDPKVKKAVDDLRQYRNKFAHTAKYEVIDADFQASTQDVISAFDDLTLDTSAVKNLKSQTSFQTDELQKIQEQLDKEKKRNQEPQTFCDLPPTPSHEVIPRSSEIDSIMETMKSLQNLHPNKVTHVYLSGNPGCGKSETARQIGEKFFNETESASSKIFVTTLNAATLDTLLSSYMDFARQLRVNEEYIQSIVSSKTKSQPDDKIWNLIGVVNLKLELFSSWLIIVDNVVNVKESSKFFPHLGQTTATEKAQVLVTTQDSHSIPPASSLIYHQSLSEGMKPDDAVNALCTISQQFQDKDVVLEIAKVLEYQPLALACTAVYMKSVNQYRYICTWSDCLKKLNEGKRENTEKPYLDTNFHVYSHSMTTAVTMAVERVVKEDKIMMFAFQILSVLAQDPIPIKYVAQYVHLCMPEEDEHLIEARIARSSLVLISDNGQDIRVHQIVHSILQDNIKHSVEGDFVSFVNIVKSFSQLAINDDEEPDYDFIMSTKPLIPHFVTLQKAIFPNLQSFMSLTEEQALLVAKCLSCTSGKLCYVNGQLKAARSYVEMSIAIKTTCCIEKTHLLEGNLLGEILYELRDFKEAKLCLQRALGREQDVSHGINTNCGLYLRALTNLGMTLSNLPEEKQGTELCIKEALAILNDLTQNIQIAGRIFNNIATAYYHLGNYAEAKTFMEKALAIDMTRFGDNHPFVFERYNDLAIVLRRVGEYNTAEKYLRMAISDGTCLYEENNPYLSTYYSNLSGVLKDLGQYEEAKECIERALPIAERVYGDNHPTLAIRLNNLGLVLKDLGQYEEAKKCMERALAIDERVYGDNHPKFATDLNNLGLVFQDLGQYEEAKKYIERALSIDERVYGDNHPTLAIHLNNLGLVLKDLKQYEEAKKCIERAHAIDGRVYGDNHPTLAIHLNNLGLVLKDLKQYEEAKKCMERAIAIDERVYGDNHPTLAIHLYNLGSVLQDLGQYEEAKKCLKRALGIAEHVYEESHPTRIQIAQNLHIFSKTL